MGKKIIMLCLACWLALSIGVVAETTAATSVLDWEISIQPKPTPEEQEKKRWVQVFANQQGSYAFDHTSLQLAENDKNQVYVVTKTLFVDEQLIKGLSEKYREQLKPGDHVAYSEIEMAFQIQEKAYRIMRIKVGSEQGQIVEERQLQGKWVPVPLKTFADSMYEICRTYQFKQ